MVISSEDDESKVRTLQQIIARFSREKLKLTFCPESLPGANRFDALADDLNRSQYIIICVSQ